MKVLIVNTYDGGGGAAIAARRLVLALKGAGVECGLLTIENLGVPRWRRLWNKAWERCVIWVRNGFTKKNLWAVSIANSGFDITGTREFMEADVIHLHWVNHGLLSLRSLEKILASGKRVVWTMHDMWPLTSICHHARECEYYISGCNRCGFLRNGGTGLPGTKSLAAKVFERKRGLFRDKGIRFVACSGWLGSLVKRSALAVGNEVQVIPNPIDTGVFRVKDVDEARAALGLPKERKLILFGAAKVTDWRKGIDYFVEACRLLCSLHPDIMDRWAVACYGGSSDALQELIPLKVHSLGFVRGEERLTDLYNAVSVFVTPSLEENLPNTIMEAMSCGTPCVGFNVGGIPEMIDHGKNGYVAEYKDASDLAAGMHWVLEEADYGKLSVCAREKVTGCYSEEVVANKYINIYG